MSSLDLTFKNTGLNSDIYESFGLKNLGISVTADGGITTVSLLSATGGTPSSTDAAQIQFRNATVTTGTPISRTIASATTLTIAGAATLGAASGVAATVYVYAVDNAGTVILAASRVSLDEGALQTTSTTGTTNSVLFAGSVVSSKAIRLIARFTAVNTASSWASPSAVSLIPFEIPVIAAQYETNTATSIANNSATLVNFEDKVYDPYNCVVVGTWAFTAPLAGKYQISAQNSLASGGGWGTGEVMIVQAFIGGSLVRSLGKTTTQAANTEAISAAGSICLNMTLGQVLDVRVFQNSGGAIALDTNENLNWVSIVRVGA